MHGRSLELIILRQFFMKRFYEIYGPETLRESTIFLVSEVEWNTLPMFLQVTLPICSLITHHPFGKLPSQMCCINSWWSLMMCWVWSRWVCCFLRFATATQKKDSFNMAILLELFNWICKGTYLKKLQVSSSSLSCISLSKTSASFYIGIDYKPMA